jgi:hypothetical protein
MIRCVWKSKIQLVEKTEQSTMKPTFCMHYKRVQITKMKEANHCFRKNWGFGLFAFEPDSYFRPFPLVRVMVEFDAEHAMGFYSVRSMYDYA